MKTDAQYLSAAGLTSLLLTGLFVLAIVVSCGREPVSAKAVPGDNSAVPVPTETKPVTEVPPTDRPALLVEALPACSTAEEGWIVYLKPESQLEACEGGQWAVIDLKGKDGAQGQNGKDGAAGQAGAAGAQGPAAKPLAANIWADPVTGTYWFLGGASNSRDSTACTGDWRSPQPGELNIASSHGMYGAFASLIGSNAAFDCGWAAYADGTSSQAGVKPGTSNCWQGQPGGHPLPWATYCIKAPPLT